MHSPTILEAGIVDVEFGSGVIVVSPTNLYGCRVGSNTFIGPFVEIQRGAIIGEKCRIQSHAFICDLVEIGNECFISHGAMFINDKFNCGGPARGDQSLYGKTVLGDNVSIGTNATILPVKICDNVVIGAGAVVTRDITSPGVYAGNPAKLIRSL